VFVLSFRLLAPLRRRLKNTRESYTKAVEPICKTNTQANEKILKGSAANSSRAS